MMKIWFFLVLVYLGHAQQQQEKKTFRMKLPDDIDKEYAKWKCSACRVVMIETALTAQTKDPKQWELNDMERFESICERIRHIYGLDLPQPGDTTIRYESYDHFSKRSDIPLYRDGRTRNLLDSVCYEFMYSYVIDEDEDKLRVASLDELKSHVKIYNNYCVKEKRYCGLYAKDDL